MAALLLLFLLKKKKKPPPMDEETIASDSAMETITEENAYISEYGLSDGVRPVDGDEDQKDLPRQGSGGSDDHSDLQNASEINPDEFDPSLGPDEG